MTLAKPQCSDFATSLLIAPGNLATGRDAACGAFAQSFTVERAESALVSPTGRARWKAVTRALAQLIVGPNHNARICAMPRTQLPVLLILAACTPSPPRADMPKPGPVSNSVEVSSDATAQGDGYGALGNTAPDPLAGSPAASQGRRLLSTAFVRVGPDGQLTVDLRDGRVLVLRDVEMRPTDYCGIHVAGDQAGARYCGGYAEVAAARPGGAAPT